MAITRTPWVDDDGTGTTGTVINNAEKQAIYDQIDATCAFVNQGNTFAANQTIALPSPQLLLNETSQAANARVTRIMRNAQRLSVDYINDANTVVLITPLQMDQTGAVFCATTISEQGRATPMGYWLDFTPAFTCDGGAVTVNTTPTAAYTLIGKTLHLACSVTLTITTGRLRLTVPGGYAPSRGFFSAAFPWSDGATTGTAHVQPFVGDGRLYIDKTISAPNWPSGNYSMSITATFPIS